jgi:diketogulonate reductase-like aldo/keto reductase
VLHELATKYNKSIAQIVLRWNIDKGVVVLPKSVTPSRIKENFEVFDFKLSQEDIDRIDALNQNIRTGADPDNFDF